MLIFNVRYDLLNTKRLCGFYLPDKQNNSLLRRRFVLYFFVPVLVTFSLAQEDSKKIEKMSTGVSFSTAATMITEHLQPTLPVQISSTPRY